MEYRGGASGSRVFYSPPLCACVLVQSRPVHCCSTLLSSSASGLDMSGLGLYTAVAPSCSVLHPVQMCSGAAYSHSKGGRAPNSL